MVSKIGKERDTRTSHIQASQENKPETPMSLVHVRFSHLPATE